MAAAATFLQAATSASDLTTYTFSGQNLGAADAGRYIVVGVQARGTATPLALSSVTVGGVSATIVAQQANSANIAALVIAAVPTGTTGDIVVTFSVVVLRCAIQAYRVLGIDSATASDTGASTAADPTTSLDIPAEGVAIGACMSGGVDMRVTWTGLTEDYDATTESFLSATSAHDEFVTAQTGLTITADFATSGQSCGVFASWAPADSGESFTVTPDAAIFKTTSVAPTTILGNISHTPATANVKMQNVAPTVQLGAIALTPAHAEFSLQCVAPTVIGSGVNVTPVHAEFSLTTLAPVVVQSSMNVTPQHAELSLLAVAPTVLLGSVTLTPAHGEFSIVAFAPSVVLGSTIATPQHAEFSLLAIRPTIPATGDSTLAKRPKVSVQRIRTRATVQRVQRIAQVERLY